MSKQEYALDRIIVKYKEPLTTGGSDMFNLRSGYQINGVGVKQSRIINPALKNEAALVKSIADRKKQNTLEAVELTETGPEAIEYAIRQFELLEEVEYAEKCYRLRFENTPASLGNSANFCCPYGLKKIGAPEAWNITRGDGEVVVGIIDTGVDIRHPAIAKNLWVNPNPGAAGYEDDLHGYDFVHRMGYNGKTTATDDPTGHGTHVAGTVAGNTFAACAGVGVAPNVKVAVIKVSHLLEGDTITAIEGINYANNMGIPITNNSYTIRPDGANALRETIENGGLFVACAGNYKLNLDVVPLYPAAFDCENIIAVAATDHQDELTSFSCYGKKTVDLAAPGLQICSLRPYLDASFGELPPEHVFCYGTMSGTSMATPHVAGAAALVLSALKASDTNTDYRDLLPEVKQRLLTNVDPLAELKDKVLTGGRLNVEKAITQVT